MDLPSRTDGVVTIRPIRMDEVDSHLAGEDDDTRRWFHFPRASTREDVVAYVERSLASFRARGPRRSFGIVDVATGALCGHVEANHLGAGVANISYSVYPQHRGRGLATRAVVLCMADAEEALPIDRFVVRVMPGNEASARLAVRCGLVLTGQHVEDGHLHDEYSLDLLAPTA